MTENNSSNYENAQSLLGNDYNFINNNNNSYQNSDKSNGYNNNNNYLNNNINNYGQENNRYLKENNNINNNWPESKSNGSGQKQIEPVFEKDSNKVNYCSCSCFII